MSPKKIALCGWGACATIWAHCTSIFAISPTQSAHFCGQGGGIVARSIPARVCATHILAGCCWAESLPATTPKLCGPIHLSGWAMVEERQNVPSVRHRTHSPNAAPKDAQYCQSQPHFCKIPCNLPQYCHRTIRTAGLRAL